MKMNKIIAIALCAGFSAVSYAQTSTENVDQKIEQRKKSKQETKEKFDASDEYAGFKDTFLKRLNVKEIPSNFPKYNQTMTFDAYKATVKKWMKENKDLLNEDFKKKMEAKKAAKGTK